MKTITKVNGLALAAAAATMFLAAPMAASAADSAQGKCMGVNACKGQSACKTAKNSCKGMNACKGQGFEMMTKTACAKAGGKFESAK